MLEKNSFSKDLDTISFDTKITHKEFEKEILKSISIDKMVYFKALKWFFSYSSKDRNTGRSYLAACVFISLALESPGTPVYFIDHHFLGGSNSKTLIRQIIRSICNKYSIPIFIDSKQFYVKL